MNVNDRIKKIRSALGVSQAKFAKGIPVSSGYIAAIELGNRSVNERLIKLISSTYGANEEWLRTGNGEMFSAGHDDKVGQAMSVFKELRPEYQNYVLQQIDGLLKLQNSVAEEKTKE